MKYVIRSARNFSQAAKSNVASVATTNTLDLVVAVLSGARDTGSFGDCRVGKLFSLHVETGDVLAASASIRARPGRSLTTVLTTTLTTVAGRTTPTTRRSDR
jgi:hypothetical protein